MKKKKSHIRLRAFCSAFMLTCCLLLLGTGFLIADYNTRRMSFGDDELRIGGVFLDMLPEETDDAMQLWSGRLWTAIPARWRAFLWMTEAERAAAEPLIEQWEEQQAAGVPPDGQQ